MKGDGKGAAAGGSTVPGGAGDSKSAAAASAQKPLPKDAQVMVAILKDMGITDYEPRVINQMLEFSYRYVTNVLDEAKAVSNHARKKTVDVDDVKLAVQMYAEQNLTSPPTRDILLETARTKNAVPLPIPRATSGMRLPPERHCLTACNYRYVCNFWCRHVLGLLPHTGWVWWSWTWVGLTSIQMFHHVAQMHSRFNRTPICPSKIGQVVE